MRRMLHLFFAALALSLALTEVASAHAPEPIRYTLRFPAPHTHDLEVQAVNRWRIKQYPDDRTAAPAHGRQGQ